MIRSFATRLLAGVSSCALTVVPAAAVPPGQNNTFLTPSGNAQNLSLPPIANAPSKLVDRMNGMGIWTLGGFRAADTAKILGSAPGPFALGTDAGGLTGTIPAAILPAMIGDVTRPAGSSLSTIALSAVTAAKLATGAAASNLGPASGDLNGSFPSPRLNPITQAQFSDDVNTLLGQIGTQVSDPTPSFFDDLRLYVDPTIVNARLGNKSGFNVSSAIQTVGDRAFLDRGSYPQAGLINTGIQIEPSRTNYLLNSTAPATQTVSLPIGSYTAWLTGSGSIALSGGASGTVTAGNPVRFDIATASTSVTFTNTGTVSFEQAERCLSATGATQCGPTSPIVTTTAAVTRNGDMPTLPLSAFASASAFSVNIEFTVPAVQETQSTGYIFTVSDGTLTNKTGCYYQATDLRVVCDIYVAGTRTFFTLPSATAGALNKLAFAYDGAHLSAALNGTLATKAIVSNLPLITVSLGTNADGSAPISAGVSKFAGYSTAVADGFLVKLTAAPTSGPSVLNYAPDYGQSTSGVGARGFGLVNNVSTFPLVVLMLNDKFGVRGSQSYGSTSGTVTGFVPAIEQDGPSPMVAGTFGEGGMVAFGNQLATLENSANVYLVRANGSSGKTIADLSKGGVPYASAISDLKAAVAIQQRGGKSVIVKGQTFTDHGVTDRANGTDPATYLAALGTLDVNFIADIKAATGQSLTRRLGITQLAASSGSAGSLLSQAQLQYTRNTATADMISPTYQYPLDGWCPDSAFNDGVHRCAIGYIAEHEKEAQWWNQAITNGQAWHALQPTGQTFNVARNAIDITLDVPVPPVVIDNTTLPQGTGPNALAGGAPDTTAATFPNYGITYVDACSGVTVAAGGVSIVGGNTLHLVLTGAVPTSCASGAALAPTVQAGFTTPIKPKTTGSASATGTNFHDSSTFVGRSGFANPNWLVEFSLPVN